MQQCWPHYSLHWSRHPKFIISLSAYHGLAASTCMILRRGHILPVNQHAKVPSAHDRLGCCPDTCSTGRPCCAPSSLWRRPQQLWWFHLVEATKQQGNPNFHGLIFFAAPYCRWIKDFHINLLFGLPDSVHFEAPPNVHSTSEPPPCFASPLLPSFS